jgi:hypothetical protein
MARFLVAVGTVVALAVPGIAADVLPSARVRFGTADSAEQVSFQRHVLPLMGRLGCNGRACHGSFQGQGGFRLSLFGYDFQADHDALTRGEAPRVDRSEPEDSLILRKPTLAQAHKGGKRLEAGSWQYRLLLRWIQQGARNDAPHNGHLVRLSVSPEQRVFRQTGESFQMQVLAHWSDGTTEDVTELSRFRSNDDAIATVSPAGLITAAGKGDTHVVAFYDNGVAPVQVMLPVSDRVGDRYPSVPTPTRVDELVIAKLRPLGIVPSELCTDAEFLRRVGLDLTGTLPAPAEVEAFLADSSPDKRTKKIDELLGRPAYAAWWTTKLCDLTGNNGRYRDAFFNQDYSRQWYDWLYRRVADNVGYDKMVAGIVLASSRRPGQSFEAFNKEMSAYFRTDHPADFSRHETLPQYWSRATFERPQDKALGFSYTFLGVRLQCAQCHKHPFDQWTKKDFEQFTAFFNRINYGTPPRDREAFTKLMADVTATAEKDKKARNTAALLVREGKVVPWREVYVAEPAEPPLKGPAKPPAKVPPKPQAKAQPKPPAKNARKPAPPPRGPVPKLLGDSEVVLRTHADPREILMQWMRRPDNPYFARAIVNRVWANYFNVGIVEPPDDLSLANPPSNPALLDYLTNGFVEHGYDLKWLHREITTSRTYQLGWKPNDTNRLDTRNFSHAVPRRLPAEVAYDALAQATAASNAVAAGQADLDQRAIGPTSSPVAKVKARRPGAYALLAFGKPNRVSNCDCERSNDPSLVQTLYLLNDGEVQGLLNRRDGWVFEVGQRFGPPVKAPNAPTDPAARAKVIGNLERRIHELETQGKKDDAAALKRVLQSARRPAPPPPPRRPAGPEDERLLIREAYLRTVSRPPTERELARSRQYLKESANTAEGLRDVLWALLNTDEFIVNH